MFGRVADVYLRAAGTVKDVFVPGMNNFSFQAPVIEKLGLKNAFHMRTNLHGLEVCTSICSKELCAFDFVLYFFHLVFFKRIMANVGFRRDFKTKASSS